MKDLLNVSDIANILELSTHSVYSLIRTNEIPAVRVGRSIRVPKSAWEAWLDSRSKEALSNVKTSDFKLSANEGQVPA